MSQLVTLSRASLPSLVGASGDRAGVRFLEFFAAQIRNMHTRRAYARAVGEFLVWCESKASLPFPRCSLCMWRVGSSCRAGRFRAQRQTATRGHSPSV